MNGFIKRTFVIFTVCFFLCETFAFSETYDEVFNNGVSFWEADAKKEAFVEFKRFIFLQDYASNYDNEKVSQSYEYLSLFFEEQENFTEALKMHLIKEQFFCSEEDLLREIELNKKTCRKNGKNLENEVRLWCFRSLDEYSPEVKIQAWKGVLYSCVQLSQWDNFENNYKEFCIQFGDFFSMEEKAAVEEALIKIRKFHPKKPMLAAHLSFIPGLGQLYAGDVKDSVNALVLNGSLIGLSVYSLCTGGYTDFALLEMKPAFRFYQGNIYNAQKDSYAYNQKKEAELKAPLLKLFE